MTDFTPTTLVTLNEREHWGFDSNGVPPIGSEERELWDRDPAAFVAIERLHDAHEAFADALWDGLQEIASSAHDGPRACPGARRRLEAAQRAWDAAVDRIDELAAAKGGE